MRTKVSASTVARTFDGARRCARSFASPARRVVARAASREDDSERTYLQTLKIANFALVSEQTIEFEKGLNVITGKIGIG